MKIPSLRLAALVLGAVLGDLATGCASRSASVGAEAATPRYRVDTSWPAPLPNNWILGQVSGIATDADDHVWVLQRPASLTEDERGATLNPP